MQSDHQFQSLTESLTEAIEDEVPISRSVPKDDITPMAPTHSMPLPPQHSPVIATAQLSPPPEVPVPVVQEPAAPEPSAADAEDTKSTENADSSTETGHDLPNGEPVKAERATIGDWMGTWFGKPRIKSTVPQVPFPRNNGSSDLAKDTSSIASSEGVSPMPSAPTTPSRPNAVKRKPARSVFGTLGFSILNPSSTAALASKKRRNMSVTDISGAEPVLERRDTLSVQSAHVSPAHSPLLSPAILPSDPFRTASSSNIDSPSMSVTLAEEKPPQGSSLRAIIQATRVMTSDPSSILVDQGRETGPLIAQMAFELVRNAREGGLDFRERPKERKERKPPVSEKRDHPRAATAVDEESTPTPSRILTTAQVGRSKPKSRKPSLNMSAFASPLFGSFAIQQQKKPLSAGEGGPTVDTQAGLASPLPTTVKKPGSVPLESIIPVDAKPPTQYLSRHYTPLTARDFRFSIPLPDNENTIADQAESHEGMTDRFGFIYDVSRYDALLLIRAKECKNTAPACLTGIKVADRKEDNSWPEDDEDAVVLPIDIVKEPCDCDGEDDAMSINSASTRPTMRSVPGESASISSRSRGASPASSRRTKQTSVHVSGNGGGATTKSSSSVLSVDSDTPRHVCANTIRRLLVQLTDIHDQRQAAQRKEWDAFLKNRSRVAAASASKAGGARAAALGGAARLLGLGTADEAEELGHSEGLIGFAQFGLSSSRDEQRELDRLVRRGLPLAYRAKAWLECSGALEMREPGVFADLLAECDPGSAVVKEIEKDVCRTMPLNIFFGRTGAGVQKLRRVLMAYSRYGTQLRFGCAPMC